MFDYNKAKEFYVDWLGFKIDWEHTFEPGTPLYVQLSMFDITLHLSEHHGDGTPGSKVVIQCNGLRDFHQQLNLKNYKYNRPGLEEAPWEALTMEVIDPFNNRLLFNQAK
jgi:catechol 2,3-dioxygenase-like lactoylglutathione lyase family enzyme